MQLNKDSHIIKIKQQNCYYWIANIYFNKGTLGKIQKLFGKLKTIVPPNEWSILCCVGDFNIDMTKKSPERELLTKLSKMMGLKITLPTAATRGNAIIDFIIAGGKIKIQEDSILNSLSDHKVVNWIIEIKRNERRKPIRIPSRETANEITCLLLNSEQTQDAKSFIHELENVRRKKKKHMMKIIKQKTKKEDELMKKLLSIQNPEEISKTINEHWGKFWTDTEGLRFSKDSFEAYTRLKNILKYHLYEKRDGGIINRIKKEDGTLEDQPDKVNELLLKTMEEIQVDEQMEVD